MFSPLRILYQLSFSFDKSDLPECRCRLEALLPVALLPSNRNHTLLSPIICIFTSDNFTLLYSLFCPPTETISCLPSSFVFAYIHTLPSPSFVFLHLIILHIHFYTLASASFLFLHLIFYIFIFFIVFPWNHILAFASFVFLHLIFYSDVAPISMQQGNSSKLTITENAGKEVPTINIARGTSDHHFHINSKHHKNHNFDQSQVKISITISAQLKWLFWKICSELAEKNRPPSSQTATYWKTEGIQSYLRICGRYVPVESNPLSPDKGGYMGVA